MKKKETRGTTLSEVMELAISKLARESKLDSDFFDENAKKIIDYVRPKTEPIMRLYYAIPRFSGVLYKFNLIEQNNTYKEIFERINFTPAPLLTPLELHIGLVTDSLEEYLTYYDSHRLQEAISEDWREGIFYKETIENIKIVHNFYEEIILKKILENNPPINANATKEEIEEYLDNIKYPFRDHEDLFELKEYYINH